MISYGYFQWDDMYNAIENNNGDLINQWFKEIYALNDYVMSIDIIDFEPVFNNDFYKITSCDNELFVYFKIYDGQIDNLIPDKYIKLELDAHLILHEIQDPHILEISNASNSLDFVYNLRVIPLTKIIPITHIIASLSIGLLITFFYSKLKSHHFRFFYQTRGLEKIIFLFEKTEEYSANHSIRVSEISTYLGKKYGLKGKKLKDLRIAALLHDIGKISVPVEILNKKGKLNFDEMNIIKNHTIYSANIIENFEELLHLKDIVLYHHEKIDGSGYPSGLKNNEIPIESRIIAIADIFEALIGQRPYRDPIQSEKAILLMKEMSLDTTILDILVGNLNEIHQIYSIYDVKEFNNHILPKQQIKRIHV